MSHAGDELPARDGAVRRRAIIAVAAVAIVAAGIAVVVAMHHAPRQAASAPPSIGTSSAGSSPDSVAPGPGIARRVSLAGEFGGTVAIPPGWRWERDRGMPAPIADGRIFASNRPMAPQCRPAGRVTCGRGFGLPSWWRLASGQVVVSWTEIGYPGGVINAPPGTRTVVGGHRAWIDIDDMSSVCPDETASSFIGWVRANPPADRRAGADGPTDRLIMTACFAAGVSPTDRHAARTLFRSLRFR